MHWRKCLTRHAWALARVLNNSADPGGTQALFVVNSTKLHLTALHDVKYGDECLPALSLPLSNPRMASRRNKMSDDEEKTDNPSYKALEEAIGFMKKAYDVMRKEAEDVCKEKEAFKLVAKKLEHVHFSSTVELNVGGQHFTTSLQTLTKDTGSMLHAMFSRRFDTKQAEDGSYFIDRDGSHFRYIFNYLRTGRLLLPEDKLVRKDC